MTHLGSNSLPAYAFSLAEIFWGALLLATTMTIHGIGMLAVVLVNGALRKPIEKAPSLTSGLFRIILCSWIILFVHLLGVAVWAAFFLWRGTVDTQTNASASASLCYYVALLDYTCLGSNYNLHERWRLLEGMISAAGLMAFAWSTGVFFTLAQDFQDRRLQLLKRWREKRHRKPGSASQAEAGPP